MNARVPSFAIRTADDFLAWNEGREGRREFVGGRIVDVTTEVSKNHERDATNLLLSLGSSIDPARSDIGTADSRPPSG